MILGIHHPALAVPDMDQALAFYCDVLGFRKVMQADIPSGVSVMDEAFGVADAGCKVRMVRKGNSCLELFEFNSPEAGTKDRPVNRTGITHFALCTDDFQADYDMLVAKGVPFNTPPFGASPARFAYGRDPFGNVFELLEHVEGAGESTLRFED
jgi:catechol 2,3-dioxygenase-like lactoylglutathione lyase family enzyme